MADVDETVAETTCGRLRGSVAEGVHQFLGVPYGGSVAGANRFKPAPPPEPWTGVRDALAYGPPSVQASGAGGPLGIARTAMDEECLVANVWTPALDDARRPVMVWLHGGGFTQGDAASPLYRGANLARGNDVVVVSLNHRLGLLGHLHLEERFGDEYRGSGVAGILDIVQALGWVRDNIAAFGGDPGCVTVFGESGGGGKVSALLAMPAARGLFHRAVIESGPPFQFPDRQLADGVLGKVLGHLGLGDGDLDKLLAVPAADLFAVQVALGAGGGPSPGGMSFAPTVGTDSLPDWPEPAVAGGASADIPLLIGTNEHEARFVTLYVPHLRDGGPDLTEDDLLERVSAGVDEGAEKLVAHYRGEFPHLSRYDLLLAIESEQFRVRSIRLAEAKVAGGTAPVYSYLFRRVASKRAQAGSFHGIEIPFVFDNLEAMPYLLADDDSPALAAEVSAVWAHFARTGVPGAGAAVTVEGRPSVPAWPAYTTEERATMCIDRGWTVEHDPLGASRRVWDDVPTGPRTRPWSRVFG